MDETTTIEEPAAEQRRPAVPPWLAAAVGGTSVVLVAVVATFFLAARGKELAGAHRWVVVAGTLVFALLGLAGIGIAAVEAGKWFAWRRRQRGEA